MNSYFDLMLINWCLCREVKVVEVK